MKMTKFLTSALAVTMISGAAIAQDSTGSVATSTTTSESILSKLEKSPLDLSFYTEHSFAANTLPENVASEENDGDTITTYNALYSGKLAYKISSKTTASLTGRFDTAKDMNTLNTEEAKTTSNWNRIILAVSQKVLNEEKHGVNLGVSLEKRSVPDTKNRAGINANGHTRIVTSVGKSLGKFSLGLSHYLAHMDRKDTTLVSTRYYNDVILEQGYAFTDKLSLGLYQDYFMPKNKGEGQTQLNADYIELGMGLSYSVTPKLSIGTGVSSVAFQSHDGRDTNVENWTRTPTYNVNLAFSAF